jgi:hypothetical protein
MSDYALNAVLFIALVIFLAALYYMLGKTQTRKEIKGIIQRRNPVTPVLYMGEYVSGLDVLDRAGRTETERVLCVVTEESYVFIGFPGDSWQEVGEAPRGRITDIYLENIGHSARKPEDTGPVKQKEWRISIGWSAEGGRKKAAVFEFNGPSASAIALLNTLRQHARPGSSGRKRIPGRADAL